MFFLTEYYFILVYIIIAAVLSGLILLLSYSLSTRSPDTQKLSTYECGFDPYEDARNAFDVRFYLVAILFIIFDIESVFLFPWGGSLSILPPLGYWCILDFFIELCLGYVYVWKVGALNWK